MLNMVPWNYIVKFKRIFTFEINSPNTKQNTINALAIHCIKFQTQFRMEIIQFVNRPFSFFELYRVQWCLVTKRMISHLNLKLSMLGRNVETIQLFADTILCQKWYVDGDKIDETVNV